MTAEESDAERLTILLRLCSLKRIATMTWTAHGRLRGICREGCRAGRVGRCIAFSFCDGLNPHLTARTAQGQRVARQENHRENHGALTRPLRPNPNRRGSNSRTCDRASVRAAAVAAATTSSHAPLQPALLNKIGLLLSTQHRVRLVI